MLKAFENVRPGLSIPQPLAKHVQCTCASVNAAKPTDDAGHGWDLSYTALVFALWATGCKGVTAGPVTAADMQQLDGASALSHLCGIYRSIATSLLSMFLTALLEEIQGMP